MWTLPSTSGYIYRGLAGVRVMSSSMDSVKLPLVLPKNPLNPLGCQQTD